MQKGIAGDDCDGGDGDDSGEDGDDGGGDDGDGGDGGCAAHGVLQSVGIMVSAVQKDKGSSSSRTANEQARQ